MWQRLFADLFHGVQALGEGQRAIHLLLFFSKTLGNQVVRYREHRKWLEEGCPNLDSLNTPSGGSWLIFLHVCVCGCEMKWSLRRCLWHQLHEVQFGRGMAFRHGVQGQRTMVGTYLR